MAETCQSAAANIRGTWRRGILLALLASVIAIQTHAQEGDPRWRILVDGQDAGTPAGTNAEAVAERVLHRLHDEGYPLAIVDSAVVAADLTTIHVSRGPLLPVASLEIEGLSSVDSALIQRGLATQAGSPLVREALQEDLRSILTALERAGRPLARADVLAVDPAGDGLHVSIRVDEGEEVVLAGLQFVPDARTDAVFAARLAGLQPGRVITRYDPAGVRRELEATGLFASVGAPELVVDSAGQAVVRVPVEEAQPGAFDLVLGYLPPAGAGDSGALVGSGSLVLRNMFGRGRRLSLELVRNPGLVASVDARVSDPFLLGLPLRLEARLSGYQQDSTFSRQLIGAELGYRFAPGLEGVAVASREFVEAGIAGAAVIDGRQRVPAADAWFGGVGMRFARVDRPMNPRSGLILSTLLEQGVKRRTLARGSEEQVTVRQQRLHAQGRLFIPTLARQTLVVGGDAAVLLGDVFDDSDLFRFGGATSLRGYDEERFRGNLVGRGLAEYRYQLDPTSFAFLFFDLGYVRRPETPGVAAEEQVLPGYGLGLQYRTPLGLVTASYALNPDEGPTRGKVHIGLSVAL